MLYCECQQTEYLHADIHWHSIISCSARVLRRAQNILKSTLIAKFIKGQILHEFQTGVSSTMPHYTFLCHFCACVMMLHASIYWRLWTRKTRTCSIKKKIDTSNRFNVNWLILMEESRVMRRPTAVYVENLTVYSKEPIERFLLHWRIDLVVPYKRL